MTPRVKIKALDKNKTVDEAQKFFRKVKHSRAPVYDESIDKVIGVLTLRQVFEHEGEKHLPIEKLSLFEPIFTPPSRAIRSLFQEFKSRHIHIAVVVDEHGGTQGIVSLEDLLEEIVGEIEDEEDVSEVHIEKLNAHTILTTGDTPLGEVDEKLGTKLDSGKFKNKNVAFLVLEKLAKIPHQHDKVRSHGTELTVEQMIDKKIEKVKIERI